MNPPGSRLWTFPRFAVHLEWHTPEVASVRFFLAPIGPLDALTGQPEKPFTAVCTLVRCGGILTACAALSREDAAWPIRGWHALASIARELGGAHTLRWEVWRGGQKRSRQISL